MPPIRNLLRLWRTLSGSICIGSSTISTHNLDFRMSQFDPIPLHMSFANKVLKASLWLVRHGFPVALTYTATNIVALAAKQAGRPDLIRSPKRVLAHTWEGFEA